MNLTTNLLLHILFALLVQYSPSWVYYDATKHKIGKIPGRNGLFNNSAGMWASCTILFWIFVLPAYILKRQNLIALAADYPVTIKGRELKLAIFIIIGTLLLVVFGLGELA